MYDSLKIQRFRAFDSFEISQLTRVNLLVGKNNAGKTCLLEAIEMASKGGTIASLLGSPIRRWEVGPSLVERDTVAWDVDLSHLFFGHKLKDGGFFEIDAAGPSDHRLVRCEVRSNRSDPARLSLLEAKVGTSLPLEAIIMGPGNPDGGPGLPLSASGFLLGSAGLLRSSGDEARTSLLPDSNSPPDRQTVARAPHRSEGSKVWFFENKEVQLSLLRTVWDVLVGTPAEDLVVSMLKIIQPDIQRLVFTGQGSASTAFLKLEGQEQRVPLGSLGDGIRRILALAIHVTLARNGVLLIDEIDTGLHYSAMESMWRFIVESARRLDIQVFATTHSGDCIRALAWLQADAPELAADISVHRIDKSESRAVRYTAKDIEIAARHHIEVRG
jgi:ABC-type branched-subunit amino acid transport system ATPase component